MRRPLFHPERVPVPDDIASRCARLAPSDAWRALVDCAVLPSQWLDAPDRRFARLGDLPMDERAQARRSAPYLPTAAHPDETTECVRMASMWQAMERAEGHGRALVAAAALWGMPRPSTILWMPIESYSYPIHDTKPGVWEPDSLVWRIFPSARARVDGVLGPWLHGDDEWSAAADHDARFVDRPSPFVPALALFACGFGILPSSTDVLVLAYPTE